MKILNLSLITTVLLEVSAQDDCSAFFTIAYQADPRGGQFCAKKPIDFQNVSRDCLYKKGAANECMGSAISFAILQGTEDNARVTAKEFQCGGASSSACLPSPTTSDPYQVQVLLLHHVPILLQATTLQSVELKG